MFRKLFLYPGPLWRLTASLAWVSVIVAVLVMATALLLSILLGFSWSVQTAIVRGWCRWVCASCFLKYEVRHEGAYDPAQPCLVVSNHQSMLDIPAAYFAFDGNLRMVGKNELFSIPLFGHALKAGGFIPLVRGDHKSSVTVMNQIKSLFAKGVQVWVAPEGTRSVDGTLAPYRWGSFGLAIAAQVPIQPIVVLNSRDALPRSSLLPRVGTTIYSVTLPQITTLGLKASDKAALAVRVRELSEQILSKSIQDA